MKYLLDTHAWIWWNSRPEALSQKALKLIQRGEYDELLLSAISLWEFSKLVEKKRLTLACSGWAWLEQALEMPGLRIVGLSPAVAWESTQLPPPFHDDPADQMIVATARLENATVITADRSIQNYPHVRTVW
jgi:PIN domain nuclease of toxin-antitoxin system